MVFDALEHDFHIGRRAEAGAQDFVARDRAAQGGREGVSGEGAGDAHEAGERRERGGAAQERPAAKLLRREAKAFECRIEHT